MSSHGTDRLSSTPRFTSPPLRGRIGPQTGLGRRETRPTEPCEAHPGTSRRPTGLKRTDQGTAPNQTANAPDQRRALTARHAEAEGATPSGHQPWVPRTPVILHHSRSASRSTPLCPRASSRPCTHRIRRAPQESHEACAQGGAARKASRNHPPSKRGRLVRAFTPPFDALRAAGHVSSTAGGGVSATSGWAPVCPSDPHG
jgi:hypothetical protein